MKTDNLKIAFTVASSNNGILTKKISKDRDNKLVKDASGCCLTKGTGEVKKMNFSELPDFLQSLKKHQAIVHGEPKNNRSSFKILSEKQFSKAENITNILTRTKDNFQFSTSDNHLLMIDYDPEKGQEPLTPEQLTKAINKVLPGFNKAAQVVTHSTSSCINDKSGQVVTGEGAGKHIYFVVPPDSDVKRFKEIFITRAWLKGYGFVKISKSGSMLLRNRLFDESVFSPERLDFVSGAVVPDGWTQNRPEPLFIPGTVFDPAGQKDLTIEESDQVNELINDAKTEKKEQAEKIREKYIDTTAVKLSKQSGKGLKECREIIKTACQSGDLSGVFLIYFDDLQSGVSIDEILKNTNKYNLMTCADPLEPDGTAGKAIFYANDADNKPALHSYAHGSHNFYLHEEATTTSLEVLTDWLKNADKSEVLKGWTNKADKLANETEKTLFIKQVSEKIGAGVRALNKDLKARKKEKQKKINERQLEQKTAGRLKIRLDVTHTFKTVRTISDQMVAKNKKIYRYGNELVMIVRDRPNTVRLVKEKYIKKGDYYPAMPKIHLFTIETLRHETEKIIVCQKEDKEGDLYNVPVPPDIVKGWMQTPATQERPLISIVEHPYIDSNFESVTQTGYDEATGLYKVFNSQYNFNGLRPDRAKAALDYILNDVLAEFPFKSELDKIGAVSCFLSGMERKMMISDSGCPGYLFTAPTQGTGKTTLAQVINYCLYGRPAAATSYSDNDEEMGKHLLAIFLEGHSSLLFDNVAEGSSLSSNEIAKAMTSPTYSKRFLGQNKTVTVPCSILWMFSGNNIGVCGDFNTRFLVINLDANMRDPDRRTFKREDIGAWCVKNREKILKALLTIIINGKDYKPGLKASRYPAEWDRLVRFPLHKLTGIDIAEIFENNKAGDPKLDGQRCFFSAWYDAFGSRPQTAKDIIEECQRRDMGGVSELGLAIDDILPGGRATSHGLGTWLGKKAGRFWGDYQLISEKGSGQKQRNVKVWRVIETEKKEKIEQCTPPPPAHTDLNDEDAYSLLL